MDQILKIQKNQKQMTTGGSTNLLNFLGIKSLDSGDVQHKLNTLPTVPKYKRKKKEQTPSPFVQTKLPVLVKKESTPQKEDFVKISSEDTPPPSSSSASSSSSSSSSQNSSFLMTEGGEIFYPQIQENVPFFNDPPKEENEVEAPFIPENQQPNPQPLPHFHSPKPQHRTSPRIPQSFSYEDQPKLCKQYAFYLRHFKSLQVRKWNFWLCVLSTFFGFLALDGVFSVNFWMFFAVNINLAIIFGIIYYYNKLCTYEKNSMFFGLTLILCCWFITNFLHQVFFQHQRLFIFTFGTTVVFLLTLARFLMFMVHNRLLLWGARAFGNLDYHFLNVFQFILFGCLEITIKKIQTQQVNHLKDSLDVCLQRHFEFGYSRM